LFVACLYLEHNTIKYTTITIIVTHSFARSSVRSEVIIFNLSIDSSISNAFLIQGNAGNAFSVEVFSDV